MHENHWLIGRSPECQLLVEHPSVSAKHCELQRTEQGWLLKDLGSTNGTFVNGGRLSPHQAVSVRMSDQILLAGIVPMPWPNVTVPVEVAGFSAPPPPASHRPPPSETSQAASQTAKENVVSHAPEQAQPPEKLHSAADHRTLPEGILVAGGPQALTIAAELGGQIHELAPSTGRTIRIGRAPDNDVVLENPTVSRYHAQLIQKKDGWYLEDLGSFNGTAVGYVYNRVQQAKVRPEDVVFFGTLRVPVQSLIASDRYRPQATLGVDHVMLGRLGDKFQADPWVGRQAAQVVQKGKQFLLDAIGLAKGVFVNGQAVRGQVALRPGDQVQFGTNCIRISPDGKLEQWNYRDRLVVEAREVGVHVANKWLIRQVSLTLFPRELVALMGPSGAGKTTFMMCLCGYTRPTEGSVLFNGESLHDNYERFSPFLGYVPQEDIMHRELTVQEALYYSARLRLPSDYSDSEILDRIKSVIGQLGLEGCESVLIGSPERKGISGGQRKRVNLAMELLTDPVVLFLDEPTSGLSSEDALLVVEVLRKLADGGKIIVVTIHQPGLDVFRLFDHLIVISKDRNSSEPGALAYFGPAYPDAVRFFNPQGLPHLKPGMDPLPDEILRGLNKKPSREWTSSYRKSQYFRDFVDNRRSPSSPSAGYAANRGTSTGRVSQVPGWMQAWTMIRRCFRIKCRDIYGTAILVAQAPIIAFLIVLVFGNQASSENPEDYLHAKPLTVFLTGLAALWFGCSNAAREIVGEWAILRREWMVGLQLWPYLLSKFAVLGGLCVFQCLVLVLIVSSLCNWKAASASMYVFTLTAALAGLGIGICISALSRTSEMAVGLLPLVLIPMVVLGGALLPVHKMPSMVRAAASIMPSRWTYEGMLVCEAEAMKDKKDQNKRSDGESANQDSGVKIDIADKHFPQDNRHLPITCWVWLAGLLAAQIAFAYLILQLRLRR